MLWSIDLLGMGLLFGVLVMGCVGGGQVLKEERVRRSDSKGNEIRRPLGVGSGNMEMSRSVVGNGDGDYFAGEGIAIG